MSSINLSRRMEFSEFLNVFFLDLICRTNLNSRYFHFGHKKNGKKIDNNNDYENQKIPTITSASKFFQYFSKYINRLIKFAITLIFRKLLKTEF